MCTRPFVSGVAMATFVSIVIVDIIFIVDIIDIIAVVVIIVGVVFFACRSNLHILILVILYRYELRELFAFLFSLSLFCALFGG
ncbi:hypothetical protein T492DRAFT_1065002 [Pavlovales sp. CCMP2436]|nr:hypothetical protein T492DRAFT_1065002 [Pavlovales sp. CCMP2436]